MNLCEKIKTDRVVCDEIFYVEDEETIPVGEIRVPGGDLSGTVTVTVVNCDPVIDMENNELSALVTFMVQKELEINTEEEILPLEFGFRFERELTYRKCTPAELMEIDPELLENLKCDIISVAGTDEVELTPSTTDPDTGLLNKDASISEDLNIRIKIKLVQEKQLFLSTCPANQQSSIDVTPVSPVTNAKSK